MIPENINNNNNTHPDPLLALARQLETLQASTKTASNKLLTLLHNFDRDDKCVAPQSKLQLDQAISKFNAMKVETLCTSLNQFLSLLNGLVLIDKEVPQTIDKAKKQPEVAINKLSLDAEIPKNPQAIKAKLHDKLTHISLNNNALGNPLIETFCSGDYPQLVFLAFESNKIDAQGFKLLAKKAMPKLQHLYLANNKVGEGLKEIKKQNWPKLSCLYLTKNAITSSHLINFGSTFPELTRLGLKANPLKNQGIQLVMSSSYGKLTHLHLEDCGGDDQVFVDFKCGVFSSLTNIYLDGNVINYNSLRALFSFGFVFNLLTLSLVKCKIDRPSLKIMQENEPKLSKIHTLDLSGNDLDDLTISEFFKIKFPKLQYLGLKNNKLTMRCVRSMATVDWPVLRDVEIENNDSSITEYSVKSIGERFQSAVKYRRYQKVYFHA